MAVEAVKGNLTSWDGRPIPVCAGTKRDGSPCPQPALKLKNYCWWHDPSREGSRRAVARRHARRATKWSEPDVRWGGEWMSKVEEYVRSRGYVHPKGKFKGQTNIYQLARESGISYGMIHDLVKGKLEHRMGMITLGKLCGFLECGPSELIEWRKFPEPPRAPREQLDDDYVSPQAYREGRGGLAERLHWEEDGNG